MLEVPVAFLIFNRPDMTQRVFTEIARAKPKKLLVVADGPRSEGDTDKCAAARAVIEQIDWDCQVLTNYSEVNLGCKRRVSSGLHWVFEQCEEAIILEDDCLPHNTFFRFCAELLKRYRDDKRVMMISGDNFQGSQISAGYSYYFARCFHIWGWATWRRAWSYYDEDIRLWPELRSGDWLRDTLADEAVAEHWRDIFDNVFSGRSDTWDYQWFYTCWTQNGLAIMPSVNLVSNIGFGNEATHTKNFVSTMANLSTIEMPFPLKHPPYMLRNIGVDVVTIRRMFPWVVSKPGLYHLLRRKAFAMLPGKLQKSLISVLRPNL